MEVRIKLKEIKQTQKRMTVNIYLESVCTGAKIEFLFKQRRECASIKAPNDDRRQICPACERTSAEHLGVNQGPEGVVVAWRSQRLEI